MCDGAPKPTDGKKSRLLGIRTSPAEHRALEELALRLGYPTLSEMCRRFIWERAEAEQRCLADSP